MLEAMRRLHPRGAANRGVCVDVDGAIFGPDCVLVRRTASGYRIVSRRVAGNIQKALLSVEADSDWLHDQAQRIAGALNRGEVALAQIYGLRIPISELSDSQLRRLATIAALAKTGFNPDEPRIPAGQPGGGEWTSDGSAGDAGPDAGDVGPVPRADDRDTPSITDDGNPAPATPQYLDQQTGDGTPGIAPDHGSPGANVMPAGYTVAPGRSAGEAAGTSGESGIAGLEAYLIQAGYALDPVMRQVLRALYSLYVTPGSTLGSLQAYLAEHGVNFDELPSVIKSLFDPPKTLAELQTNKPPAGFNTEAELRKYLGDPPPGYEWHHIIEQNGQFRPDLTSPEGIRTWIQNTANMVMVPVIKHYCINGIMSSIPQKGSGVRIRDIVKFHNPLFQSEVGIGFLKFCGVIQ